MQDGQDSIRGCDCRTELDNVAEDYKDTTLNMQLLRDNYAEANLGTVMCRSLVSVDWQGYLYDCDFNQMLALPMLASDRRHLRDLLHDSAITGLPIATGEHCYGCTAGQGSSCGGALEA